MFRRRHLLPLAAAAAACLFAASGTSARSIDDPVTAAGPEVTITEKPNDPSNVRSPSFAFTTTEPATFECKLDTAAFAACASPIGYAVLADGPHTFVVHAIDAAASAGPDASYGWTVDATAPTATITERPSNPSNNRSPSFAFTTSEPPNVQCQLDSGAFTPCTSPTTYTNLADGPHMFVVRAIDGAGNIGEATYSWTVDTLAPTVTIGPKPTDPSNSKSPSFTFNASESSAFACKLDSAAFAPCTAPASYTALADGRHTFTVRATDPAGNTGAETSYSWTIDATGPAATITQSPTDPSNNKSPSFAFTASESGSTFGCRLDGAAFAPCTSPTSYTALADGPHSFVVRAIDALGNIGGPATYAWRIDTAVPTATIAVKPTDPSSDRAPRFGFTASDQGSSFSCRLDAAAFAPCSSPTTYTALADGRHTFAVKATDPAGNIGGETSYSWTIDATGPTATITQKPTDPSNDRSPTFAFTGSETSTFECKLDAAPLARCTSATSYAGLTDGVHTFGVRATDALGNAGVVATYRWTIETVAPTATITQRPTDPSNDKSPSFTFNAGDPSTFACKLDAATFSSCTSPTGYANLADGPHTFVLRATDTAGNTGEASYSWTIDTAAPTLAITDKPSNPSSSKSPSFAFTATGAAEIQCKLDGAVFAACTSPTALTNLADGPHTFTVRASDAAGNAAEATFAWTVDTLSPAVTITEKPTNPSNDKSPSFAFTASELSTFECKLDTAAFAACTSPTTYSSVGDGQHTFTIRATDRAGNGGVASYAWTIDATPPTAAITQKPTDPTNNSSPSFAFAASETGSSFSCRLDAGTFASCPSPKSYTALADGSHTFAVKATDPLGNTGFETSYTWRIDTTPPTATITQKPGDPSNTGSPSFTFTASESGSSFLCRLEEGGFTPCSSPKVYSNLPDGAHTFGVKATDAAGNTGSERSYGWTVDTTAPTVAITDKPSNPSNTGSPTFALTTSESSSSFACSLDGGGFATCTSSPTYSNLADGAHTFAVRATDPAGNTGPATSYSWTIETKAPTASITHKPGDPSNSRSPSFGFSADEPSAFKCKLDGAAFAACASPTSYTDLAEGRHAFAVKATDPAGNTGAEVSYSWTIDAAAPAAAITDKPSDASNNRSPSFAFSAGESGSTFTCRLDEGSFAPCTSPTSYAELADGPHVFAVKATDAAGNTGPEATFGWTIETRAPTPAVTSGPKTLSNSSSAAFAFSADEPSAFECNLDERGFEPCSSPASYHGLGDGAHGFSVRARDALGNLSAPTAYAWTIDVTAPETTIGSAPRSGTAASSGTFRFSASESAAFECKLDEAPFALCTSPKTFGGLGSGEHRFEVRAIDGAGNVDATPSLHGWTIGTPVATASSSTLLAPRAGARVTSPPLLVWRRSAKAGYYNVQIFRGARKVFTGWPTRPRLRLRARWTYLGRKRTLAPGLYRWYVWPGYGRPSARRYGPLLGQSTFTVVGRQLRR